MHDPTWIWTDWNGLDRDQLYDLARLRQQVFIVEQTCPYLDLDGLDPRAYHLLGTIDGVLVAVLRAFNCRVLRPENVIGRVVVAPSHRGQGLASRLMQHAHQRLDGPVWLSAQAHLEGFYAGLGYAVCGPGYDEDGIPHLPMLRG